MKNSISNEEVTIEMFLEISFDSKDIIKYFSGEQKIICRDDLVDSIYQEIIVSEPYSKVPDGIEVKTYLNDSNEIISTIKTDKKLTPESFNTIAETYLTNEINVTSTKKEVKKILENEEFKCD